MTESEAIIADQCGDATAALALCQQPGCEGGNARRDDNSPVFMRNSSDFRQYADGLPTNKRLYRCRYCRTPQVFPAEPVPSAG